MRSALTILLVALLALAGVPHLLCSCGCSPLGASAVEAATATATTGCPHCCQPKRKDDSQDRSPSGPRPCHCGACEKEVAVKPPDAATPAIGPSFTGHGAVEASLGVPLVAAEATAPTADRWTLFGSAPPLRALPILLGRLLL